MRRRTIEALDAELDRLKKEEATVRQTIGTYEQRLEATPGRQQEYSLVTRDYQAAKDLYDSLLKRYEEARFDASVETDGQGERFRVLEPALPPGRPRRAESLPPPDPRRAPGAGDRRRGRHRRRTARHLVPLHRRGPRVHERARARDHSAHRLGALGRRVRMAFATVSVIAAITLVATLSAYFAQGNEQIVRMLERAG